MNARGTTRWAASLAALLIGLACAAAVRADSFSDARDAFRRAQAAYEAGNFQRAADEYQTAYRLSRSPVLLYNVGLAYRREFQKSGNYDKLVEAARNFNEFLDRANPDPQDRARAEANLTEVEGLAVEEAKRRFQLAQDTANRGDFLAAIALYDAAYQLSGRLAILYNLALAERSQFELDQKLERLARAEQLVLAYRRLGGDQVAPAALDELLALLATQRQEYQRKREALARSQESAAMRAARENYQQGDPAAALASLAKAEAEPGNSRLSLVQLYRLRGQAAVLAGKESVAIEAFKRYLALEPASSGEGLGDASALAFAAAKEYWRDREPLKLEHLPPGTIAPRRKVNMPVRVASDPLNMISDRVVRYRREGGKEWTTLTMREDSQAVELPPQPMPEQGKAYKIQYYITATDAHQNELDALGNAKAPLAFLVSKDAIPKPPPLYKRWWVWAGAGAIVAGSIATYAIIQAGELPAPVVGDVPK